MFKKIIIINFAVIKVLFFKKDVESINIQQDLL